MYTNTPFFIAPWLRGAVAAGALWGAALGAGAQSVALSGVLGKSALLVVDGGAPKAVAVGDAHQGVRVVSVQGDAAVVEIKGQRSALRVGDMPVSVGRATSVASSNRIVLFMGEGGHFFAQGRINGQAVRFVVDTGATAVTLGLAEAQRLGLHLDKGRPVRMSTANGQVQAWQLKLDSVRIGDVEVFEVDAIVGPNLPIVLLGNSFLNRFSMNRSSDTLVLERRY